MIDGFLIKGLGVVLRAWGPTDGERLVKAGQDPDIARFTSLPQPYGPADAEAFVRASKSPSPRRAALAILTESSSSPLGAISIRPDPEQGLVGRVGYWLLPEARGSGKATCALQLLSSYLFETGRYERLEAWIEADNSPSRRVAERVGYRLEGLLRRRVVHGGVLRDVSLYGLVRGEQVSTVLMAAESWRSNELDSANANSC